ncbi:MAG: hypothetical protein H6933_16765 [Burkholderiaceae bacterium]|nr:hypothetical protein [Burkholderiaceae bacterium]
MQLLHRLIRPKRAPAHARRRGVASSGLISTPSPTPDGPHQPADDRAPGCGWFDSSHELHQGLNVTEHRDVDAVVNQIPLSWWLGWELDAVRTSVR